MKILHGMNPRLASQNKESNEKRAHRTDERNSTTPTASDFSEGNGPKAQLDTRMQPQSLNGDKKEDVNNSYEPFSTPFISPDYIDIVAEYIQNIQSDSHSDTSMEDNFSVEGSDDRKALEALFAIDDPVKFVALDLQTSDQKATVQTYVVVASRYHFVNEDPDASENEENSTHKSDAGESEDEDTEATMPSGWYYKLVKEATHPEDQYAQFGALLMHGWFPEDSLEFYCGDD